MVSANAEASGFYTDWFRQCAGRALGAGELGVVMADAGVGKTTFLAQVALDELLAGHDVLHVALGQTLARVQARYDTLLGERIADRNRHEREALEVDVARCRAIQTFSDADLEPAQLATALNTFEQHLDLKPSLVVVDGADPGPRSLLAKGIPALKRVAAEHGATLWLTARTSREQTGDLPATLPAPVAEFSEQVDLAIFLQPAGDRIQARMLAALGRRPDEDLSLSLAPDSLRPIQAGPETARRPAKHTLLSGAARGAEAAFGACAERWGLGERNFTFSGRRTARKSGLVVLGPEELALGDVSWTYLRSRMKRTYPENEKFRKVLQSIWHQVNPAGEVFAVGLVQSNGTVKGGTGWAVELAKHQRKPVWVYDQQTGCWYEWFNHDWRACDPPIIRHFRFCGTGTRNLAEPGLRAIEDLFERSFGPPS